MCGWNGTYALKQQILPLAHLAGFTTSARLYLIPNLTFFKYKQLVFS
jgi:hypothetical protein